MADFIRHTDFCQAGTLFWYQVNRKIVFIYEPDLISMDEHDYLATVLMNHFDQDLRLRNETTAPVQHERESILLDLNSTNLPDHSHQTNLINLNQVIQN